MELEEKVKRVTDIFAMILEAKDIKGLEKIEKIDDIKNYKIDLKKYPELKFSINKGDINELTSKNIINSQDFQDNLKTPLEKLLYAMAWKNGDLLKLMHILKGIQDSDFGSGYTIKEYESLKSLDNTGGWKHSSIRLKPLSVDKSFENINLVEDESVSLNVLGKFIRVL